eukprot:scaffold1135_cov53-Phaeocystis_antarctica.AAC.6
MLRPFVPLGARPRGFSRSGSSRREAIIGLASTSSGALDDPARAGTLAGCGTACSECVGKGLAADGLGATKGLSV